MWAMMTTWDVGSMPWRRSLLLSTWDVGVVIENTVVWWWCRASSTTVVWPNMGTHYGLDDDNSGSRRG